MYSLTSFFLVLTNSQPLNSTQISTQQRFYGTNHFFERGIWPGVDSLENLRKLQRDTMTLSCGRGLKCFSSLKGTNSYITHYLLSYFFFFFFLDLKGTAKAPAAFFRLTIPKGTKIALLTPKSHFVWEFPLHGAGFFGQLPKIAERKIVEGEPWEKKSSKCACFLLIQVQLPLMLKNIPCTSYCAPKEIMHNLT